MTNLIRLIVFVLFAGLTPLHLHAFNGIETPKIKWRFKTEGTIRGGSVVAGDRIYFGSADGSLYALNKHTGEQIWKFETDGAIAGAPAVSGPLVFVSSRDHNVYAIDRSSGNELWRFTMKPDLSGYTEWEYFTASPVVHGTTVFVGSGDGNLYALKMNDGRLIWKYQTKERIRATPTIHGNMIFQPANDGILHVLNIDDGALAWKFETQGASFDKNFGFDRTCLFTKPCIRNGSVIFGSRDGHVYAVDLTTRQEKWKFTYGSTWAYSTTADEDAAYIGWSTNNTICAVDIRTGLEKWKFGCGSVVYTTAAISDEDAFFGSADGKLYCVNKKTGTKKWEYDLGAEIFSSPVFDTETIFVGSDNGYFYAIDNGTESHKAVYQPLPSNAGNYPLLDGKIAPYLIERGFDQLDSAKLYTFILQRINDKIPSVVVFAYDAIPSNIIGENPEDGMVRKYLESGGRILWFGGVPNLFQFDTKGRIQANGKRDISIATRLLDVKFASPEESGNYYCKTTQAGLNFGLPSWFKSTYSIVHRDGVTPLGIDEWGRVGPWMKKFNSRPGSGFISLRPWAWDVPIRERDLELIYEVAIYQLN